MTVETPVAPDRAPARRAREELARCRDRGLSFEEAWQTSMQAALAGAHGVERAHWEYALRATRASWEAAYQGRAAAWCGALELLAEP